MRATVVDMNILKREERIIPVLEAAVRNQSPVLLPEALLFEGVKGRDWEAGLRDTLRYVARFRQPIVGFARRIRHLVEHERRTGTVIVDIAYREQESRMAGILDDVRSGTRTTFDEIRRENPEASDIIPRGDDEDDKAIVLAEIERVRGSLSPELQKRLRVISDDDLPAMILSRPERTHELENRLRRRAYSEAVIESISGGASVTAHQYLAALGLALWWIANGGASTARPKTMANDVRDLEYLVLAMACTDLVTDDGKLKTLYRTLRLATKIRTADYLQARGPLFISPTKDHPVD